MSSISEPTWPSVTLTAVTKSDATVYTPAIRQLYVGTGGDVTVETESGAVIVFKNVASGSFLGPFFIRKVRAATTAADIVAFI